MGRSTDEGVKLVVAFDMDFDQLPTPLASSTPFTVHTAPHLVVLTPDHKTSLYSDSLHPVLNSKGEIIF